jgi:hypothetical protein
MNIGRIFLDVDMRMGFDGLKAMIKGRDRSENLTCIFINRAQTSFKLLVNDTYIVYYRNKRRIPLTAIKYLPKTFGGSDMEMKEMIRKDLATRLKQDWGA